MKKILVIIVIVLGVVAVSYRNKYNQLATATITQDTVIVRDTIIIKVPTPKVEEIRTDTVFLPSVKDSTLLPVLMPMERKVYTDSTFKAVISGFQPKLESLSIFPTNTTITEKRVVKSSGNGLKISPSVGVGYGVINRDLDVYIGVSLQYNFWEKK